jgi:lipopolysaccharide export system permease protein
MLRIIDRYILKQVVMTMSFAIMALCAIFIIVDMLESLDEFLDTNASFEIIFEYYMVYLPEIMKILFPIAMLLAILFTVGRLSSTNEITAIKTGGMSLYRIMIPLLIFSIFVSIGQLYFNGWVVPKSNTRKLDIAHQYLRKGQRGKTIYNLYFRDTPNINVIMQYYDGGRKMGSKVAIEEFTDVVSPRLVTRMEAASIQWDEVNENWKLTDVIDRKYEGKEVVTTTYDSLNIDLNLKHNEIAQLKKSPDEMTYDELWDYIQLLDQGGKNVRRQLIEYYGNYAFPFANFVVVLFGVPFASIKRKGGIALQLGSAMIISFMYLVFTKISQTIGYSSEMSPILAGWVANIIFFIIGLFVIIRTRT